MARPSLCLLGNLSIYLVPNRIIHHGGTEDREEKRASFPFFLSVLSALRAFVVNNLLIVAKNLRTFAIILSVVSLRQPTTQAQENPTPAGGFSVRKETPAVSEAIEDFERYRDKKAWEKAFAAIAKVADSQSGRLVPATGGFFVPTSRKIRDDLLTLSAEGREAYRLFNDAKAQKMLQAAVKSDTDNTGVSADVRGDGGESIGG